MLLFCNPWNKCYQPPRLLEAAKAVLVGLTSINVYCFLVAGLLRLIDPIGNDLRVAKQRQ